MLGDRERCIQAQMDEYLSKPLKQNHLIQTILKCATLGGALLEKGKDVRPSVQVDDEVPPLALPGSVNHIANADPPSAFPRPNIEPRASTTTGPITHGSLESPDLVVADVDNASSRVSKNPVLDDTKLTD